MICDERRNDMKKVLCLVLALVMVLGLTGCELFDKEVKYGGVNIVALSNYIDDSNLPTYIDYTSASGSGSGIQLSRDDVTRAEKSNFSFGGQYFIEYTFKDVAGLEDLVNIYREQFSNTADYDGGFQVDTNIRLTVAQSGQKIRVSFGLIGK